MYCNNCNNHIDDDSLYCRYCGKQVENIINNDNNEEEILKKTSEPLIVKHPSMRWFNFLVKFLMPLWIFSPLVCLEKYHQLLGIIMGVWLLYNKSMILQILLH